jgi:hypothetical protein
MRARIMLHPDQQRSGNGQDQQINGQRGRKDGAQRVERLGRIGGVGCAVGCARKGSRPFLWACESAPGTWRSIFMAAVPQAAS